jgi:hypothetical protein
MFPRGPHTIGRQTRCPSVRPRDAAS